MKTATPNTTHDKARRCRFARRSPRSRGAVMVLALLGGFMIVGMIGYVFNTGRHAQLRQQTQSAADSTAISGAGYVARSFNTVAMNNVEISRLIAVVQLLDAVPQALEYTLIDVRATLERVEEQLAQGVCSVDESMLDEMVQAVVTYAESKFDNLFNGLESDLEALIRENTGDIFAQGGVDALEDLADTLYEQERMLEEMDEFFNLGSYDVREMTFYESEFGRGELWKAMESLDAISTATMEQLGELTQTTAIDAGRRNMRGTGGESLAAVAPFDRAIDWKRYEFDDFRDPVVEGRLPNWVDDEVTNRGPYDTIFGWRYPIYGDPNGNNTNNNNGGSTTTTTSAGSRWSGSPSNNSGVTREIVAYSTFGPRQWLGHRLYNAIDEPDVLQESQFTRRVYGMSGIKLNYLWPGSARSQVFLDPEWITDYGQAVEIDDAGTPRIAYTQFVKQEFHQEYVFLPYDDDLLEAIQAEQYRTIESSLDWDVIRPRGGWFDVPGLEKTCNYIWDDWWQTVGDDRERRLIVGDDEEEHAEHVDNLRGNSDYTLYKADRTELQPTDPSEEAVYVEYPIMRTEIMIIRYIWAGINVGPEVIVRDPNNFASREDLAAPLDFDHNLMDRPVDGAPGYAGSPFAFLGLAKQSNEAAMWGQLFDTSAFDGHVGIAQASVFNNHSWDLWTQMWHAQLEPVQEYDLWVDLIQDQLDLATGYEDLSAGELEELANYLQSLESLAPIFLTH